MGDIVVDVTMSLVTEEGGDSNNIRSYSDAIDEEDEVSQSDYTEIDTRTADAVFKVTVDMVRHKLMGLKIRNSMCDLHKFTLNLGQKWSSGVGVWRFNMNFFTSLYYLADLLWSLALESIYEDGSESAITCINNEHHMNTEISAWSGKSCAVYTTVWQNWFCSGTEVNSFASSVPLQITMLPNLEILSAPSANIDGEFPRKWGDCPALKMEDLAIII
nr:LRR receptor-like serine/threonine-protein kinase RPK2 [Tanacetum cinerariifolium]